MKEEIFENFNLQGLFELSEEKFGKKVTLKNSGLLYIWYIVERNHVRPDKQSIVDYLLENRVFDNTRDVTENTNRYLELRSQLPRLTWNQNRRLDKGKQYLDPVVPFEKVGSRMLGIINNDNQGYSVVDISEGRENIVGVIHKKGGINWRNNDLDGIHMKWVLEKNNELKGTIKEIKII
jgi:hypothetical protein